jgi:hypothetical protein
MFSVKSKSLFFSSKKGDQHLMKRIELGSNKIRHLSKLALLEKIDYF